MAKRVVAWSKEPAENPRPDDKQTLDSTLEEFRRGRSEGVRMYDIRNGGSSKCRQI